MNTVIDFGMSKEDDRIVINSGISSELDMIRIRFEQIDDLLDRLTSHDRSDGFIPDDAYYEYLPQLGYLLVIPKLIRVGAQGKRGIFHNGVSLNPKRPLSC